SRGLDKVLKLIGRTPEEVTLDLDWSSVKTESRARSEHGRSRERSDRNRERSRGRPASETSVASMEPLVPTPSVAPPPPSAELHDEASAPTRPRRRPERAAKPRPPAAETAPAPARE